MTMKVRIEDKEALDAISWKALRAYLDRAGWQQSKDIPGKGVIYKRTGPDRRLREIAVPLRRDLADYAARMGDAVGTLARVEDRSELDVYDDLRALGARMESNVAEGAGVPVPVVDEATRAVHERIRKWLAEEGWHVEDVANQQASIHVMATLKGGASVNIFQLKSSVDHLTLAQRWTFDEQLRSDVSKLPVEVQKEIAWNIYRDVSLMGVELDGFKAPPHDMAFFASVYFDGLNKDVLVQRILLTIRAINLAIRTLMRAFEEHNQSVEAVARQLRMVRPADGPLTVAS